MSKRVTRSSARPVAPGATVAVRGSTYLGARAGQVGAKHDRPRSLVVELLAARLETIFKELDVATTAIAAVLVLHFVLDNKRLIGEVNRGREWCADSVMRSLGLSDEALVTCNNRLLGLLDGPFTDVAERFGAYRRFLCRLRHSPALRPVIGELLEEGSFDVRRLRRTEER